MECWVLPLKKKNNKQTWLCDATLKIKKSESLKIKVEKKKNPVKEVNPFLFLPLEKNILGTMKFKWQGEKKIKGNLNKFCLGNFVFEGAEIQMRFYRVAVNTPSNSAILGTAGIPSKHMEFPPPASTHTLKNNN